MSPPSNDQVLLLTTSFAVDENQIEQTPQDTLRAALAEFTVTNIRLDEAVMDEADWDAVLSAILQHNRCITL